MIDRALSGAGGYATLTGVHGVTSAPRDPVLRAAFDASWMNFPDGVPGGLAAAPPRRPAGAERVGGPDLMPLVIDRGRRGRASALPARLDRAVLGALQSGSPARFPGADVTGALRRRSAR